MNRKERIILVLLAALNFTHTLDFMIMMPLNNYLEKSFDVNAFQFSVLVGAYSISAFFSGLTIALFIDRFDRKKTLIVAYIGFLVGTIACGFANSYLLLLAGRIVAGIFGGIIGAQILSIVADLFNYERRGRAVGAVMAGFAVASVIGVPVSLYLVNILNNDWHAPFLLIGATGLILLPLVNRHIPSITGHINEEIPGPEQKSAFAVFSTVWNVKAQRNALLFSGMLMVGHFLILPFLNAFLEFNKGYSKNQTPILFFTGGGASLLAAVYLGRLADKYGKLNVFSMSVFLSLFFTVFITQLPDMPFGATVLIFFPMFMLVTGRLLTAQSMVTEVVASKQRGSFMSINGSIRELGSGIAAICAGVIVHSDKTGRIHYYDWVGYLSIAVLTGTLLFARVIFARHDLPKEEQAQPEEQDIEAELGTAKLP